MPPDVAAEDRDAADAQTERGGKKLPHKTRPAEQGCSRPAHSGDFMQAGEFTSAWGTFPCVAERFHAVGEPQERGGRSSFLEQTGIEAVFAVTESLFQLIFKNGAKTGRKRKHEKRQKPRNHPANPVGGPDLPCITLPGAFRSDSKRILDRKSAGPFSHSPILDSGRRASAARGWFRDFMSLHILYHTFCGCQVSLA